MIIGIPKEIKRMENRVSMTPGGAETLVRRGHTVLVEAGAGLGSGCTDEEYTQAGSFPGLGRGCLGRGNGHQGQGAPARGVRVPALRPDPVHLSAPGCGQGP